MTNEKIREKIIATGYGKGTLVGFENCICEVEFYKNYSGYFMQKKGAKGFADDALCQFASKDINGLIMFMQGALWFRLHGKEGK